MKSFEELRRGLKSKDTECPAQSLRTQPTLFISFISKTAFDSLFLGSDEKSFNRAFFKSP